MTPPRQPKNIAVSVRARLLEASRRRNVEFQQILSEFAIERLLYRLGISPYAERFVLKGAMLFKVWSDKRIGQLGTWTFSEKAQARFRMLCPPFGIFA
jgi:hypothetical protein